MSHATTVSVLTRLRPTDSFAGDVFQVDERNHTVMAKHASKGRPGLQLLNFSTHGLLPASSTQEDVYKAAGEDMVQLLLEGYNGTVFAYGQTGAGKTYTMTGGQGAAYADRGLIPRVIDRTFQLMDEERHAVPAASPVAGGGRDRLSATSASAGGARHSRGAGRKRILRSSTLSVSYLEIYNEQLYDLLSLDVGALTAARAAAGVEGNHTLAFGRANDGTAAVAAPTAVSAMPELTITEDKQGGTHVRGLTRVPVRSAEEALSSLFEGDANRAVAEHALNATSTRSHCVFTLYLERVYTVRAGASGKNGESDDEDDLPTETVRSKLHLVDLAGSERIGKTHTAGGTAVQASFINKSLTFLEQVVLALLSTKREHVPYRSSKLTNMLKDSLGGNCRTRMVACVWPTAAHAEESIATLRFATRMMKVKTFVSRNVASSGGGAGGGASSAQVAKLEGEIRALRRELAMHDALVGRTGVRYGPITPAEGGLIADLCEAYVDAPSDDEDAGGYSPSRGGAQTSMSDFDRDAPGAAKSMALPHGADGAAAASTNDSSVYQDDSRKLHTLAPAQLHEARLLQVTTMRQVAAAFASLRSIARQAKQEARLVRRGAVQAAAPPSANQGQGQEVGSAEEADSSPRSALDDSGRASAPPPASHTPLAADATAEEAHLQWKAGAGVLTVQAIAESKARLLGKKADAKRIAKSVNACKKRIDGLVAQLTALPLADTAASDGAGGAPQGGLVVPPAESAPAAAQGSTPGGKEGGASQEAAPPARPASASSSKSGGAAAVPERGDGGDTPADAVRGVEGGSSAQGKHEFTWDKQDAKVAEGSEETAAKPAASKHPTGKRAASSSTDRSKSTDASNEGEDSSTAAPSSSLATKSAAPEAATDSGSGASDPRAELVQAISVAKQEYRELFGQLKAVKSEVAFLTQQLGGLKAKALKEFDAWLVAQKSTDAPAGEEGAGTQGMRL